MTIKGGFFEGQRYMKTYLLLPEGLKSCTYQGSKFQGSGLSVECTLPSKKTAKRFVLNRKCRNEPRKEKSKQLQFAIY